MVSKIFLLIGLVFLVLSAVVFLGEKVGIFLFRLPGDIVIQKGNFTFYFPITTCILLSVLLTILFSLFK